jgi:plastocyanin
MTHPAGAQPTMQPWQPPTAPSHHRQSEGPAASRAPERDGAAARLGWGVFLLLVGLGALLDTLDVLQVPPGTLLPAALTGIAARLLVGWKSGAGQPLIALGLVLLCASVVTTLLEPGSGNQDRIILSDGQQATNRGSVAVTGDTIEIVAGDAYFDPTVLTGPAGQQLQLTVRNQGKALHNIAIDGQGIDQDIKAGATATVQVRVPTSGAVTFVCKYHLPQNMRGELRAQ